MATAAWCASCLCAKPHSAFTCSPPVACVRAGETKIGISYAKLCQSVAPGKRILIADGTLSIEVLEILSDTELRGRCLNGKSLGPRKNVNLPGVKVDIPVLTAKDVEDLQLFCCKNRLDFVAASFVQVRTGWLARLRCNI